MEAQNKIEEGIFFGSSKVFKLFGGHFQFQVVATRTKPTLKNNFNLNLERCQKKGGNKKRFEETLQRQSGQPAVDEPSAQL